MCYDVAVEGGGVEADTVDVPEGVGVHVAKAVPGLRLHGNSIILKKGLCNTLYVFLHH